MKICYVNPTTLVRRPIADLIGIFGDKEEVALFIPRKPFKKVDQSWHSNSTLKKAKIFSYPAINIPLFNFEWPIPVSPFFLIQLLRIFKRYDVIHLWTFFYISSWTTLFFKLFSRKRLIISCDTFPGLSFKTKSYLDFLFRIYYLFLGRITFSIPNKVHIYGKSMIKYAKQAKAKNLIVLPTGIDLKKFAEAKPTLRKKFGIEENELILIFAGLLIPRKGIDLLIKISENLEKQNFSFHLIIVGDGPKKKEYVNLVKKLNLQKRVTFTGWRKEIPGLLKMADILLLPSRGEGLPGIVMEAMASNLPVIASNIPCIPDLITSEKSGILCQQENEGEFFEAIKFLSNKKNRVSIGRTAQEEIKKFSWGDLIKDYRRMYKCVG